MKSKSGSLMLIIVALIVKDIVGVILVAVVIIGVLMRVVTANIQVPY